MAAIEATVPEVLTGEPMTRERLAAAVAGRIGRPGLEAVPLSGWGAVLQPNGRPGGWRAPAGRAQRAVRGPRARLEE